MPTEHSTLALPDSARRLTWSALSYASPYPPLGFVPIAEGQLGNGDHFGFYWPIGQEDREPLVVEVWHDDWSLQPKFSRVARFIEALGDEDSPPDTPSLSDDPDSPLALFLAAKEAMRDGPGGAIAHLQSAVARLPEFRDAQALLAAQYRRVGDHANSVRAAIAAIISPGCFGAAPVQLARWLSAQTSCPPEIEADPVWRVRERLTLRFGGVKENDQYDLLGHAIDEYIGRGQYGRATTLMQMYAQEMARETISFRDRYSYAEAAFLARQVEVAKLGGSSRLLATSKSRSN